MSLTYFIVTLGILLAKALGFVRDVIFGAKFGTSVESDVYFGVFGVVTLIFTGIGTALQTLVIKNLNKPENSGAERQRAYAAHFIRRVSLWVIAATAVLYIFAPQLTRALLPDLREDYFPLAVRITYIMLPSLFFVVVAYIISGILQNSRVFFIPSIVSLPFNVLIIARLLFGEPDIVGVSIATTVGWGLHILFQLPSFYKHGYRFFLRAAERVGRTGSGGETAAIFVSNMVFQLCFIIDRRIFSGSEGAIASVNYASNLFLTVSSVFVVAMSSVIFPAISKNFEEGKLDYVRRLVRMIITIMLVIFVPYLLVASVFGRNVISLIWERGSFDSEAAAMTAVMFVIYSFSVFGYIAEELFSKILYLSSRYVYTVSSVVAVTAVKLATGRLISEKFGIYGVAVSTTVILTLYAAFITYRVSRVIGGFFTKKLAADAGRILFAGALALGMYFLFRAFMPGVCADRAAFILPLAVCGAVYLGALFAVGLLRSLLSDMKNVREGEGNMDTEADAGVGEAEK